MTNDDFRAIPHTDGKYVAYRNGMIRKADSDRPLKINTRNVGIFYNGKFRPCVAARLVWEAFNGEISEGFHILHRDGNELNNALDNLLMARSNMYYLPDEKVRQIFRDTAAGYPKEVICALYGLNQRQLKDIVYRRLCCSVDIPSEIAQDALSQFKKQRRYNPGQFSADVIRDIRDARAAGVSLSALARLYGVSPSLISRIGSGQRGKGARIPE